MDLLNSPFSSLIRLQGQLIAQEQEVESEIAEFLQAGSTLANSGPGAHLRLEELRFARAMLRYRIMDAEAVTKARKQLHFETRVLEAFALLHPEMNAEFQHELAGQAFKVEGYDCPAVILQSIETCYRKLESSFQDQSSMLNQMALNASRANEMKDWFGRVNHALMKSKAYFSRQCGKARSLRMRFAEAYGNNGQHHAFTLLRARYGAEMIDALALAVAADSKRRKAA
ncbi:hypothetical protein DV532_25195 (plasmid) [Pseudomonas sp. Leaf58]|uniref:hypothetical protein n=1 Tax=Pseudomonas sp. Leaf58 TaxID=1736226 RepID=UPI0006FD8583|nr:hypothetical protein [Pseudomonas sp. Leaf58]AYG47597.1 hypothetical protein DV532_25195 [Pseudomonas sp. Leaf58]KQN61960.1 hypothetical protein ASF02_07165 [Pseudomonas sp. Leaf58]